MWHQLLGFLLVGGYLFILIAIALYGLHRYVLLYLYCKHRDDGYKPLGQFDELPRVTVQLPMYNEDAVAERIIRATCMIDYPLDRLEIQVLDDSTDHSADIARQACEAWAAKGYPIKYIHRDNRTGYKAGALAAGLKQCSGQFIAIFDADFIPPTDILHNVIQYFTDRNVGMVQVRWDHLNRNASLLTRTQAMFLDAHFVIEHTARNRSGRFMHFNGTAGVWRRKTIEDAGNWEHDTLTEDLDLSYRAQLKGWQFVYLPQICAPAELPSEIISFKAQAHRWTKGSFQTAIKLLWGILSSKTLSYRIKSEAFFHLTNTLVYPLMVMLVLLIYPTFFIQSLSPFDSDSWGQWIFSFSLFVLATCSASMFFVFGQRELFGNKVGWQSVMYLPFLMALGVGMCINNAKAVLEAIWSSIRRTPSEFVRTPKYGTGGAARHQSGVRPQRMLTFKKLWMPFVEIAFGVYVSYCMFMTITLHCGLWADQPTYGRISLPFLLIFATGFFYVGFGSLHMLWRMNRDAHAAYELPDDAAAPPADAEAVSPT